jgi:hypothetical protein
MRLISFVTFSERSQGAELDRLIQSVLRDRVSKQLPKYEIAARERKSK